MDKSSSTKVIRAIIFILFIAFAIIIFRYSSLNRILDPDMLRQTVEGFGAASPFIFILAYAIGITLFLPATLFTGIGAVLFGTFKGFLLNITGAMLSAALSFAVGRYLGRDFASSLIGDKLKKYDQKIAENGFSTVLYLRLVFFPFTPLNFGMGLTRIRFNHYFWGTFFGIVAGGFIMTFFFATLTSVWETGNWFELLNAKSVLSLVLFIASFFIPKAANIIFVQEHQGGKNMLGFNKKKSGA